MRIIQALVDGIAQGGIIALAAMAITLVFRISHFANVAFGDMMTVGAYIALGATTWGKFSLPVAALVAITITAAIGFGAYFTIFRPLGSSAVTLFITSIGVALVL